MDPQVGSTAESRPWSETIAAESAFLSSFRHAAPTAGKATWCQEETQAAYTDSGKNRIMLPPKIAS